MYPNVSLPFLGNIATFFLVISLAVVIGMAFLFYRNSPHSLSQGELSNLNLIIMVSAFFGGRIFHVIYEDPTHYLHNPISVLTFWNGGFVFYGGLILAFACSLYYLKRALKKNQQEINQVLDFYAPASALTYGIGRIGCFLNGCCFGKEDSSLMAIQGKFPIQLLTSGIELVIFALLLVIEKYKKLQPGTLFFTWLALHSLNRMIMESQRVDFRGPIFFLSISTWLSLMLFIFAISQIIKNQRNSQTS